MNSYQPNTRKHQMKTAVAYALVAILVAILVTTVIGHFAAPVFAGVQEVFTQVARALSANL